jgi:hypothetical protein
MNERIMWRMLSVDITVVKPILRTQGEAQT